MLSIVDFLGPMKQTICIADHGHIIQEGMSTQIFLL